MSPNPEEPRREKPEWEKRLEEVQRESFLDLKEKARKNELEEDEKEELNRRKDMIYNIFFGDRGFLKERENFKNKNLRTDYDAALESLSQNLQKDFLKVPDLTWKDLKEKIFEKDEEVIEIQNMGKKIQKMREEMLQNEEKVKEELEKVKDELMDYLERKIKKILAEKAKKPPEQKEKVQKEKEESETRFIEKNYQAPSAEDLGKKLKEAKEKELEKWKEAIREHNEKVRNRAERIKKARKEQAEEQREVPIFCYKLPKRGETEEQAQEREEHNKKEFERFLEYCRKKPQKEENKEEFLKFVKEKWDKMWERAVKDVERIKEETSPKEEKPESKEEQPESEEKRPELIESSVDLSEAPNEEVAETEEPKEEKWSGLKKLFVFIRGIVTAIGTRGIVTAVGAIASGASAWSFLWPILSSPEASLWWPVLGVVGSTLIGGVVTSRIYEQLSKFWKTSQQSPDIGEGKTLSQSPESEEEQPESEEEQPESEEERPESEEERPESEEERPESEEERPELIESSVDLSEAPNEEVAETEEPKEEKWPGLKVVTSGIYEQLSKFWNWIKEKFSSRKPKETGPQGATSQQSPDIGEGKTLSQSPESEEEPS